MKLLNLGCGSSYHPSWTNIDFVSVGPEVIAHNLLSGIPVPDDSFDAVYHSHVLEHFSKSDARSFIDQCHRVLKSGGIIRIAIPDLEGIARGYLQKLEECIEGKSASKDDYDWFMLELYDQVVRNAPGGDMEHFLSNLDEKNRSFVRSRIGAEAENFWLPRQLLSGKYPLNVLMSRISWGRLLKGTRVRLAGWLVYLVAGKAALQSFRKGIFRDSGEVHQWMYDRYSLKRLLDQAGFVNVKICAADESQIPEFEKYSLDVLSGAVRKPDSLYVEGCKP